MGPFLDSYCVYFRQLCCFVLDALCVQEDRREFCQSFWKTGPYSPKQQQIAVKHQYSECEKNRNTPTHFRSQYKRPANPSHNLTTPQGNVETTSLSLFSVCLSLNISFSLSLTRDNPPLSPRSPS